jgi:epoxyqueuosine reductase
MVLRAAALKEKTLELGFNFAGVIPAASALTLDAYFRWIDAGMHGRMGYLARPDRQARRRDLNVILPGVRSMVLVGLDYRTLPVAAEILEDPARGRIASYAWGLDYHDIMTPRLEELAAWLQRESAGQLSHRVYVDTGAILERAHAQQAGMGFIGKNTMLIHPRRGSYFFLGEILIDAEFDQYDTPARESMCGTCTRCLIACPTDAFPRPFVLDARRCISYLTIEDKGWIERELRPLMSNWVFGCDICQDVCPWQRFVLPTAEATFYPTEIDRVAPPLLDLLALADDAFRARYRGTPIYRIKRARLVRNACIAAGNWGSPDALPPLRALLSDDHPLVRGHAAWALHRIAGDDAQSTLRSHYEHETDPDVRGEINALLPMA